MELPVEGLHQYFSAFLPRLHKLLCLGAIGREWFLYQNVFPSLESFQCPFEVKVIGSLYSEMLADATPLSTITVKIQKAFHR